MPFLLQHIQVLGKRTTNETKMKTVTVPKVLQNRNELCHSTWSQKGT
jgi:hypothetical protein